MRKDATSNDKLSMYLHLNMFFSNGTISYNNVIM